MSRITRKPGPVTFCLAGSFASGSRRDVAAVLTKLNYRVVEDISGQVDYLLIGSGTAEKSGAIDAALSLIFEGYRITLLHEDHWLEWLGNESEAVFDLLKDAVKLPDAGAYRKVPSKAKDVLWEGDHLVRFQYRNSKGEESDREVKLKKVSGANGVPKDLSGYCMLRKMSRTFKASNVISAEVIDTESGEIGDLRELLARL